MTARDARSPDGRTWRVEVDRDKLSLAEARREPFFKWHVVVTILVLLALLYVMVADQTHLGLIYVPIGLAIWFVGWILVTKRPIIRADTPGPPAEHRAWFVTSRGRTRLCLRRVVRAIERGDYGAEPRGTRLVEI